MPLPPRLKALFGLFLLSALAVSLELETQPEHTATRVSIAAIVSIHSCSKWFADGASRIQDRLRIEALRRLEFTDEVSAEGVGRLEFKIG